jgi:hypothetical protein
MGGTSPVPVSFYHRGESCMIKKMIFIFAVICVFLPASCLAFEGAQATVSGKIIGMRVFNDPMYGIHNGAFLHIQYTQAVTFTNRDSSKASCSCPDWYFIIDLSTSGGRAAFTNALIAYSRNNPVFVQLASRYLAFYSTDPPSSTFGIEIRGAQTGSPVFY